LIEAQLEIEKRDEGMNQVLSFSFVSGGLLVDGCCFCFRFVQITEKYLSELKQVSDEVEEKKNEHETAVQSLLSVKEEINAVSTRAEMLQVWCFFFCDSDLLFDLCLWCR
jgi:hypothetical protein